MLCGASESETEGTGQRVGCGGSTLLTTGLYSTGCSENAIKRIYIPISLANSNPSLSPHLNIRYMPVNTGVGLVEHVDNLSFCVTMLLKFRGRESPL